MHKYIFTYIYYVIPIHIHKLLICKVFIKPTEVKILTLEEIEGFVFHNSIVLML